MMVYATASRGYKAAAITTNSGDLNQIKPETVVDYEAGSKLSLLDRRMRFNVALFHEKFKDFQAQAYNSATPPTFTYTNAGALESEGFEAELTVNPIEHLTLGASTALAKTKYDSYFPSCYILIQGTAACNGPAFGATAGTFNAAGLPLANSPKWTVNLTESYDAPLNRDLNFFVTTDYAYRTSAEFQVGDPGTTQPAFGLMNGSAGIRSSNDSWRVGVWVKNLFDKNFLVNIYDGFFEFPQYLQEPTLDARRSFGLSLTVKFGGGPIH